jgi:hypothetical protein
MPQWLKGSLLTLVLLAALKPAATLGSTGTVKTASAAGWLLLVPPFAPSDPPGPLQTTAPLNQWPAMDSTKTAADCREQRNNMIRMSQSANIASPDIQFELLLYHYAVCIRSSDPRLRWARHGHRTVRSFMGFPRHDRFSTGYAGPPVEQSSKTVVESPPPLASLGILENPRMPILLMLIGFVLMATAGPLGGWLREKIRTPSALDSGHSAR